MNWVGWLWEGSSEDVTSLLHLGIVNNQGDKQDDKVEERNCGSVVRCQVLENGCCPAIWCKHHPHWGTIKTKTSL